MSVQAYYVGEVEYHLVQFIVASLRPGFVMFDVGAHHGAFTLVGAFELKRRGWKGLIHSFEPDPDNFAILEYNVRQNDLDEYVVLHREAMGDVQGSLKMAMDQRDNSGNFLASAATAPLDGHEGYILREVPVTTLDSWTDAFSEVHLVKLDIQGAEPMALTGGRKFIDRFRPILVIEAVPGWPSTDQIRERLLEHGYIVHGVDARGRLCSPNSKEAFVTWDWVGVPK